MERKMNSIKVNLSVSTDELMCQSVDVRSDVGSFVVVKRTIERNLAAMQKMGVLIREGNTSAGHWVIVEKKC